MLRTFAAMEKVVNDFYLLAAWLLEYSGKCILCVLGKAASTEFYGEF